MSVLSDIVDGLEARAKAAEADAEHLAQEARSHVTAVKAVVEAVIEDLGPYGADVVEVTKLVESFVNALRSRGVKIKGADVPPGDPPVQPANTPPRVPGAMSSPAPAAVVAEQPEVPQDGPPS